MNNFRGSEFACALLYVIVAPALLFVVALAIVTSKIASALFGTDPAAELVEQLPGSWAIINLTGRCTLGLLFVALLLRPVL